MDRRLVTCIITFGLITPYMWIPAGFGKIYHDVLQTNAAQSGLTFDVTLIPKAMTIPKNRYDYWIMCSGIHYVPKTSYV